MAATGVCPFPGRLPSVIRHEFTSSSSSSSGKSKFNPISIPSLRLAAVSTDHTPTILTTVNNQTGGSSGNDAHTTTTSAAAEKKRWPGQEDQEELDAEEEEQERLSLTDFFEQAKDFVTSNGGGAGPPRWFSPLHDGGSRLGNSPLLLFLPGIYITHSVPFFKKK